MPSLYFSVTLLTMTNKNLCNKCEKKHIPPTGKKCKSAEKVQVISDKDSYSKPPTSVLAEGTSTNNDIVVLPQAGVPVPKGEENACQKYGSNDSSSCGAENLMM